MGSPEPLIREALPLKSRLPTPISPSRLRELLVGYDEEESLFLIRGFLHGFSVGFVGNSSCAAHSNSRIARQNQQAVDQYIEKEYIAGRIDGPFSELPFSKCHVSPLSLREKSTPGVFRVIHDLSFPYDEKNSVNDGIPKSESAVNYSTIQDAIDIILKLGRHIFLAKSDIKSAFRCHFK